MSGGATWAWLIPLVVLAIPPIMVTAYEGVLGVDRGPEGRGRRHGHDVAAGSAQGRDPGGAAADPAWPAHGPIQVVATATIAAYIGLGGLGRYIIDGLATNNYGRGRRRARRASSCSPWSSSSLFTGLRRLIVPAGLRAADPAILIACHVTEGRCDHAPGNMCTEHCGASDWPP